MPAFQLIECMVALAGDEQQIVHRGGHFAVTYPELIVLQFVHGEEAVTDAYDEGRTVERENAEELTRLRSIYSRRVCMDVFPGSSPRLPPGDSRIKPRVAPTTQPRRRRAPTRADYTDPAFQAQMHDPAELVPPAGGLDSLPPGG